MDQKRLIELAIEGLQRRKEAIELEMRALTKGGKAALAKLASGGDGPFPLQPKLAKAAKVVRKRARRTLAQRKAQAKKMRAYWAKRKAKAKKTIRKVAAKLPF